MGPFDLDHRLQFLLCRLPEEVHCDPSFPACPQSQQRYSEIGVEVAAWAIIEKCAAAVL